MAQHPQPLPRASGDSETDRLRDLVDSQARVISDQARLIQSLRDLVEQHQGD